MDITSLFITALLIGFSGAMVPGPMLTATINESYHKGFIAGPRLVLGHALLELLLIIGLILGLGSLLVLLSVKVTIALIGGTFLLWMGIGIIKDTRKNKIKLDLSVTNSTKKLPPEVIGVLTSLSNPYWTLWWATVGLGYITLAYKEGLVGLVAFYFGHISADFIWYTLIAVGVSTGKKVLSDNVYRIILLISGIFLIMLAIYFYYSGFIFMKE